MACTLVLDCSLGGLHMALADAEGNLLFAHSDSAPRAADALHIVLQEKLATAGMSLADVSRFVATVGPGSFTGIRMGLAVGQALKVVNPSLQLVGVGTLEALATGLNTHQPSTTGFTIATDAAGGSVYLQTFAADGAPQTAPICLTAAEASTDTPLFCTDLTLLPHARPLPPFNPASLLVLADNAARHQPFTPLYVKPLAYKKALS
ncbi:MAG: tRNA (adenosine(37)-N6)-threonylcarbamoyltransferase complex dimerization subunit type 1 TsaB [Pseudomonadaceae bacterium]|nr:tRNA (adenosine(37)-N6)-threonylcarbamoyltransferase complex dimerization subunit type 1 TsaB [Pseudomonadaceae bacterium]